MTTAAPLKLWKREDLPPFVSPSREQQARVAANLRHWDAIRFLEAIFAGQTGTIELRPKSHDGRWPQDERRFVPVTDGQFDPVPIGDYVDACNAKKMHAYFGVAVRKEGATKGDAEHCVALTTLFIDGDYKNSSEKQVRKAIYYDFPLPPSIVVSTGGGLHAYWFLPEPLPAGQVEGVLKPFVHTFAVADQEVSDLPRVLRLPGTLNVKPEYGSPRPVVLDQFDSSRRYAVEDILPHIRTNGDVHNREKFKVDKEIIPGDRHSLMFKLLRSQKARGISFEAALQTCLVENRTRCNPPLAESEVRAHLKRSWQQADRFEARVQQGDPFPLTESGDAEFFADCVGEQVRFDHRRGRWLVFNDHYWAPQSDGEVHRLALEAIRARQAAALKIPDTDVRQRHNKWAMAGESRKRQVNMLALAQNFPPLADPGDNWDADPWLLCVRNGVVDLRTGTLRAGRPADRITMCASVAFDPEATCPLWDDTVSHIFAGDHELITYIDRFLGYSLTGDCREETLAFCWGNGANGKGTVMNTFAWVLGDYADDLPFSALELHDRSGIPNDIAKIVGRRFVTSSETGESRRLNEARIKALTGRDPITARFLHREFFTFQPVAKFWLATNQKPIVRDTSVGFWRRMHLIPFTQSFASKPDLQLKDKLRAEGSGILARAVRGCLEWQAVGLQPPAAVRQATSDYQKESEPLARFLDACCLLDEKGKETMGDLLRRYVGWAASMREPRLGRHEFSEAVRQQFTVETNSKTQRVEVQGIRLVVGFGGEM